MADKDSSDQGLFSKIFDVINDLFTAGMLVSFIIGGMVIGIIGVTRLVHIPSRTVLQQAHAEMARWSAVDATLFELRVLEQSTGRAHGNVYWPELKYRYTVDGQDYTGSEISMKPEVYAADNLATFEQRVRKLVPSFNSQIFVDSRKCAKIETAHTCSMTYPPMAQKITVYYDPLHPEHAILNNTDYDPPSVLELYGGSIIGIAFGVIVLALLAGGGVWLLLRARGGKRDLSAVEQAIASLREDSKCFRYVPESVFEYLMRAAFGLVLLMFCVMYFVTQPSWREQMDGTSAAFLFFGVMITPIGVLGGGLMLMPYTRTVIDFTQKTVVLTRWFLLLIPIRRQQSFSELRYVRLLVAQVAYKKSQIDHTIALVSSHYREAIELFNYRRFVGETDGEHPAEILELAKRLAERIGIECKIVSDRPPS